MKRSEVYAWLQQHGGQQGIASIERKLIDNPKYDPNKTIDKGEPKIEVTEVTWVAKDGKTLTVQDPGQSALLQAQQEAVARGDPNVEYVDPEYQYPREGDYKNPSEPVRTERQQAQDTHDLDEAEANYRATGHYETNAQRDARLRQEAADKRQQEIDALNASDRQIAQQNAAGSLEIQRGNLAVNQAAEARAQAAANQPHFLSQAGTDNPYITTYNPQTGTFENIANPNYDNIKKEAEAKRADLSLAIQLGQLDRQQAEQEYTRWFGQNVQVPLMMAQEERARAADARAAMQAEENRNQFAADFGLRSAQFGQTAGQNAAQNELALLPYRTGPEFAGQFSDAINGLAAGGVVGGPSPAAGIHFTPEAFQFKRPDIEGIAKRATAAALKHLTPYTPTSGSFPTVGGSMPNIDFSSAPQPGPKMDLSGVRQSLLGKYTGPAAAPAPPPAEQPATP